MCRRCRYHERRGPRDPPEAPLSRLYLIVGGAIVAVLFAALIVPWFINWSDYRPSFESQASRILGHPVHVLGTAHASILPSPSVTFTDVAVGDPDKPLMTVSRFAVTVELLPLIQRQIHVVAMKLDEPRIHVAVDATGATDWLRRSPTAEAIAPDSVALTDVSIRNGSLDYRDASTGVAFAISNIAAGVEATSLAGPWKITGSYGVAGTRPTFSIATGRALDDGSIRVKFETSPPQLPLQVDLDGSLSLTADAGLKYSGTYAVAESVVANRPASAVAPASGGAVPAARTGWESEGTFALTRGRVAIDKAVLSHNAADGAASVAGSLTVTFGDKAAFDASIEAKQLDLDRALGGSATQPASVADAVRSLVGLAAAAPAPPIPGRVTVSVPAVVIGGAVVEDVAFTATTAADGWEIAGLNVNLPGQASLVADGKLTLARQLGFAGKARFTVGQPAVLAGWWRATPPPVSAVPIPAFAVGGETEIAVDRLAITNGDARVGDATLSGSFSWSRDRQYHREIDTDLKADRLDVGDLSALAGLIAGAQLSDLRTFADRFQLRFAADSVAFKEIAANQVVIDAGYADDTLKVVQIAVGDIGGASVRVTSGRIDGVTSGAASGRLDAHLDAEKIDGLAHVAATFAPDSGLARWLDSEAEILGPASADLHVAAPAKDGVGAYSVAVSGVAGPTTFSVALQSNARPQDFLTGGDRLSVSLDSPDSVALSRLLGIQLAAAPAPDAGGHIAAGLTGVPARGLATTLDASLAGLSAKGAGTTTFDDAYRPTFKGNVTASSEDIVPVLAAAGIALPGLAGNGAASLAGTVTAAPTGLSLAWQDGRIAGRAIGGDITLSPEDGRWRLAGSAHVDLIDLRWLTMASFGSPLVPSADPAAPWSKALFAAPAHNAPAAKLALAVDRLVVADNLAIAASTANLSVLPGRVDLNVTEGNLADGKVSGTLSMRNAEGAASLAAQLTLRGASIAPFVWRVADAPLVTGTVDLTANLEAGGRSAAALVSSLTGGGTIALHNAAVAGVNDDAVAPIVRAADVGEQYAEDALKAAVDSQIGSGSLAIADAGSAFAVSSGTVRFNDVAIDTPKVSLAGDTAVDLNRLAIDSGWTWTFKSGGAAADLPSVGVAFRGPLAQPTRAIDVVPLSSYLSTRQAGRMLQILAIEDASRLEQERFAREILRFRDEGMRVDRARRADAAAAEAQALAAHAALAHAVELTTIARDTAAAAATAAASTAAAAHTRANTAATALAKATSDRDAAVAAEVGAAGEVNGARTAASAAATSAADLAAAAAAADRRVTDATDTLTSAQAAADKVDAAVREADDRLEAARRRAADASAAATAAEQESAAANAALDVAGRAASEALKRSDSAQANLAAADKQVAAARQEADRATVAAAAAVQTATTAEADRARLAMLARDAAEALTAGKADRDAARLTFQKASTAATSAQMDVDSADQQGAPAFTLAAKKAGADSASQTLKIAQGRYSDAEAKAAVLAAAADAAAAAAEKAANVATLKEADAANAKAVQTVALAALDVKTKARDAAAAEVAAAATAAKDAGTAFDGAQARVHTATDQAASTAAAAGSAVADLSSATRSAAAMGAGSAGFALEQATAARNTVVADAEAAHAKADTAKVAAADARARLNTANAAHEGAAAAAMAAETARGSAAKASADADAAAVAADTAASAAAELARQRGAEAAAAASALQAASPVPGARGGASVPPPRQRPKVVPGAVAGDGPLQLVPLAP